MYWDLEERDGIGYLTIDHPEKQVNTLGRDVMEELEEKVDRLAEEEFRGMILKSGKQGSFIAGADINELRNLDSEEEAYEASRQGQLLFQRINDLPFPTIGLIHGVCLGGGFELALACDYRIASDGDRTELGCPEVSLGIIPGWGGTQRLPRLVGLKSSIRNLLTGSSYDPGEARSYGVVDAVLDRTLLEDEALDWIQNDNFPDRSTGGWSNWGPARWYILRQAEKDTLQRTRGNMPAPLALIRCLRQGLGTDLPKALEVEAEEFGRLAMTVEARNLTRVYFLREHLKKYSPGEGSVSEPIEQVGVIGAGTMGSGIAHWVASNDTEVVMTDVDPDAVSQGMQNIRSLFDQGQQAGALTSKQKRRYLRRLHPTLDYEPLRGCDLIIEAVIEKMEVKKEVFRELHSYLDEDTIVATNTSALSVTEMGSSLARPQQCVGLHFFNPVYRMPLIEVVESDHTETGVLQRSVKFVQDIGKLPVVVKDRPGFLVNRVLVPYLNEAGHLLDEGYSIQTIDDAMVDFGMPMGPLRLIDEVGIDVGFHVAEHLKEALSTPYPLSESFQRVFDRGLTGKKGGEGFYRGYPDNEEPNPEFDPSPAPESEETDTLVRRMVDLMVAESVRCLQEEVVATADLLDGAVVFGTGFAPFRGGLLRHAETYGLSRVVDELQRFQSEHGDRYQVPQILTEKAESGGSFTGDVTGAASTDNRSV